MVLTWSLGPRFSRSPTHIGTMVPTVRWSRAGGSGRRPVGVAAGHETTHRSVPRPIGQAVVVVRVVSGRLVVIAGQDLLGEDVEAFVSLALKTLGVGEAALGALEHSMPSK